MRARCATAGPDSASRRTRAAASRPGTPVAAALALQRAAGNRAVGRALARWIKHPDSANKGVMVADVVAEEYGRFNPPKNE